VIFRKAIHCRHAAGGSAVLAMSVQLVHLPHIMEPMLFGVSALLTVYEPLFVIDNKHNIVDVPKDPEEK
jgi:hypothetical protein